MPPLVVKQIADVWQKSYAAQHDHFLRRHLRTNTCTILGGSGREQAGNELVSAFLSLFLVIGYFFRIFV